MGLYHIFFGKTIKTITIFEKRKTGKSAKDAALVKILAEKTKIIEKKILTFTNNDDILQL